MANLRKTITINASLIVVMLVLAIGHWKGQGRLVANVRRIEAQASEVTRANPANVVSSCSALVAVFFAWRSFTGYRRRCQG